MFFLCSSDRLPVPPSSSKSPTPCSASGRPVSALSNAPSLCYPLFPTGHCFVAPVSSSTTFLLTSPFCPRRLSPIRGPVFRNVSNSVPGGLLVSVAFTFVCLSAFCPVFSFEMHPRPHLADSLCLRSGGSALAPRRRRAALNSRGPVRPSGSSPHSCEPVPQARPLWVSCACLLSWSPGCCWHVSGRGRLSGRLAVRAAVTPRTGWCPGTNPTKLGVLCWGSGASGVHLPWAICEAARAAFWCGLKPAGWVWCQHSGCPGPWWVAIRVMMGASGYWEHSSSWSRCPKHVPRIRTRTRDALRSACMLCRNEKRT